MIIFNSLNKDKPYQKFRSFYLKANKAKQKNIEAVSISSFNKELNEVDARFVNLKFVEDNKFIFFSNYNSPKSIAFKSHNQICAVFYWPSINAQIRMKGLIERTSRKFNIEYFKNRALDKNSLAIISNQSKTIASYEEILANHNDAMKRQDLTKCPEYWGGFAFIPFYFEFWEGHKSRINLRKVFIKSNNKWKESIIQP